MPGEFDTSAYQASVWAWYDQVRSELAGASLVAPYQFPTFPTLTLPPYKMLPFGNFDASSGVGGGGGQPATPPDTVGIETGDYRADLYGKNIPLYIGGKILLGGRIVDGPYFGGTDTDPTASYIAYHALNVGGNDQTLPFASAATTITQARLRGQEVWNSTSGYIATDKLPADSFDWRPGHCKQTPFAQSLARYGALRAIPYTYGIVSSWQNIPLKPFAGIVPFPSVLVSTSLYGNPDDGIPRSDAIRAILRWLRYHEFEFEVDVSGADLAWIIANETTGVEFLASLRSIFVNYQITHTDKIRIIEPTAFSVVAEATQSNVQRDSLTFKRTDPLSLPQQMNYTYIDVDRDYEMNTALAEQDIYPIPTTDALKKTDIELPIVTTSEQAMADVHVALYEALSSRVRMRGTLDRTLFGLECGDGIRFGDSPVVDFTGRVAETQHDFEKWNVSFEASEILRCDGDPDFEFVVLLLGFNGYNGSTAFDDEGPRDKPLTYNATAVIDTSQSVFGGSSLKVFGNYHPAGGVDAFVSLISVDADFILLSSFTFEGRFKFNQTVDPNYPFGMDRALFGTWDPPTDGYLCRWYDNALEWLCFGGTNFSYAWTPTLMQWYAIAIDYDGTKCRMYIDGVMVASATGPQAGYAGVTFAVGCQSGTTGQRPFNGWIEEFRFSNGVARYASDAGYSVASVAFPRS